MDVDRALEYLAFVEERHRIWENRQAGWAQMWWTDDPILATRKFTNVFRVLDPGSQFVLTDLLPDTEPEEFLLRCFLYRHTGNLGAWEFLYFMDAYPRTAADLDNVLKLWREYRENGGKVFTGAYLVYPQSSTPGTDKVESIIRLTQRLSSVGVFRDFVHQAFSQPGRFYTLRDNKGVADFMSMQVLTDFGYSTEFRENEFVVAGPGAKRGAAALGMKPEEAIRWAHAAVLGSQDCPRAYRLKPSLMDIQNTLCEFSKFVRYTERVPSTKPYVPAHPGPQPAPVLPALW